MNFCVPTLGDNGLEEEVCEHFGRAPTFTVFDTESGEVRVIPNTSEHMGGDKKPPELLDSEGIDVLACGNLGRKAISLFEDLGIEVYVGAEGVVSNVISDWEEDDLELASKEGACEGDH